MEILEFDVIVVGGGSAGCVVASRLCQAAARSICLVEAGPDFGPAGDGRWPAGLLNANASPHGHDWGYVEERPHGNTVHAPRGKVIGGCSAYNHCAAVWGLPADYDRWAGGGNPGWSYRELRPLIDGIERAEPAPSRYRGAHGPLTTRAAAPEELAHWQRAFLESARQAGYSELSDLSAPDPPQGIGPLHLNVRGPVRWNSAFAFLDPVRPRSNLTILADTLVDRLLVRGGRAEALRCTRGGAALELRAETFVLCAGAYGSPAILLRSGVGPAEHLTAIGIPVQLPLPGVGQNMAEHPGAAVTFDLTPTARRALEADVARTMRIQAQVMFRGCSPSGDAAPDFHIVPHQDVEPDGRVSSSLLVFNLAPRARGRVSLRGPEPSRAPRIEARFFSDPGDRDLAVVAHGVGVARRLAQQPPLQAAIAGEQRPGAHADAGALRAFLRREAVSYSHAAGTCRMGPDSAADAVVDASGRVHGLGNTFVADASIMPELPRAHPNLTCMLIGLRVAGSIGS